MKMLASWAADLGAYLIKGIFIMIGKWRLKAIRNGIKIEPISLSAEYGDSPYPRLRLELKFTTKTDGKVNTNNLIIKLDCGNWEVYRSLFNTRDSLPQKLGCRKDAEANLFIHPPLYFWMVAPDKLKVKGELFVSSIWGSTSKEVKSTELSISDIKEVARAFITMMEQRLKMRDN